MKKLRRPTVRIIKMDSEEYREIQRQAAEHDKQELADALWRRHQARRARLDRNRNSEWLKFANGLYNARRDGGS